ncbi:hypothetical protein CH063_12110 [Colletotrichum higginsianum]|uniref:Secreted protein n=1 Tax=Colletotrichum higginsianum (strain IMI 349063) TaxID=759273 RepID=H1VP43_COLHI|nr:hypothetical protein CH063_12110 [Colletotrichum higginsianum]
MQCLTLLAGGFFVLFWQDELSSGWSPGFFALFCEGEVRRVFVAEEEEEEKEEEEEEDKCGGAGGGVGGGYGRVR